MSRSVAIWALQGHGYDGNGRHWARTLPQGLRLIGLDTTITGDWHGRLSRSGRDFLRRELTEAGSDNPVLVASHHMLAGPMDGIRGRYTYLALKNQQAARNILAEHDGPVLNLSGHLHLSTRFFRGLSPAENLLAFTVPSTVSWPLGYTVFTVSEQGVAWETFELPVDQALQDEAMGHTRDWVHKHWERPGNEDDATLWRQARQLLQNPEHRQGRLDWPAPRP